MDVENSVARALAATEPEVAVETGNALYDAEAFDAAAECFRHAVASGARWALINLGNALKAGGRAQEAIKAFTEATTAGDDDAWLNLADTLESEGDLAGALMAHRAGSRAGDKQASMLGAFLLMQVDEPADAEIMAALAVDQGSLEALGMLAHWRWEASLDPVVEADLRTGAEHYEPARVSLADLLTSSGRFTEAADVLTVGVQRGDRGCFLPLGKLYADHLDRVDLAEATYRAGIDAGDTNCFHNLGILHMIEDRREEARKYFELGADAGDVLAARTLAQLEE